MNFTQEHATSFPTQAEMDLVETKTSPRPLSWAESIGWGRLAFLGLVVFFLIALGYSTVYRGAWSDMQRTDFTVYRNAGQAVIDGGNLYEVHNARGWNYVYPPPFAVLMVPFAKISVAWGCAIWYLISMAGLVSAMMMAVRLARQATPADKGDAWSLYEAPIFLVSPWLMSGLTRCQASEFMVWLMIASAYFWRRGRHMLGGASLAAAALMKAFPLAFLAYFAWRRQWRFIGGFVLCLALGGLLLPASAFGWQKSLDYWQKWGRLVGGPALASNDARKENPLYEQLLNAQKPRNQSLEALLLSLKAPPDKAKWLLAIIAAAMLAAMAFAARGADGNTELLVVSAFLTWNLLIPPISESHYFGLMLLPLAALTAIARGEADLLSRRLSFGVLVLFFIVTLWSSLDKDMQLYRLLCWATSAIWASLLVVVWRRGRLGLVG